MKTLVKMQIIIAFDGIQIKYTMNVFAFTTNMLKFYLIKSFAQY